MSDNYTNQYASSGFQSGLKSSDDFAQNRKKLNYLDIILEEGRNGDLPLMATLSKARKKPTARHDFYWTTLDFPTGYDTFTAEQIYSDSSGSSQKTGTSTAGEIVYVTLTNSSFANQVAERDEIRLEEEDNGFTNYVVGKVVSKTTGSSTSLVGLKILNTNASAAYEDLDTAKMIANINPEGATFGDSVNEVPDEDYNYTQKIITPLELTEEAMAADLIYGGAEYNRLRKRKLMHHYMFMEQVGLLGVRARNKAANNKSEYTTGGLITTFVPSANIVNYKTVDSSDYNGKTWLQGGEDFLDTYLEVLSRYKGNASRGRKIGICGGLAMKAINDLAKNSSNITVEPGENEFGLKVRRWMTNLGLDVDLYVHPLWRDWPTMQRTLFMYEPENITYTYFSGNGLNFDTKYYADKNLKDGGYYHIDAIKEAWKTHFGLAAYFPNTMMVLTGLGQTNTN